MPDAAVQIWLDKASEDENAVTALRSARLWGPAAYHVQQSAEKYLKAAITAIGGSPPKTHDLHHLLSLVTNAPHKEVDDAANLLTIYAWLTRYPGAPPISELHVEEAVARLAVIKPFALAVIASH